MTENEKLVQNLLENNKNAWKIFDQACSKIIDTLFERYQINDPALKKKIKQILIKNLKKDHYEALQQMVEMDRLGNYLLISIIRILWKERNQPQKPIETDELKQKTATLKNKQTVSIPLQNERSKIIEQFLLYLKNQNEHTIMLYIILNFYFKKNNIEIGKILFLNERQVRYHKNKTAKIFITFLKTNKIEYRDLERERLTLYNKFKN